VVVVDRRVIQHIESPVSFACALMACGELDAADRPVEAMVLARAIPFERLPLFGADGVAELPPSFHRTLAQITGLQKCIHLIPRGDA
jgi:hypothetical protein